MVMINFAFPNKKKDLISVERLKEGEIDPLRMTTSVIKCSLPFSFLCAKNDSTKSFEAEVFNPRLQVT